MGFFSDVWNLAKETPDDRRQRELEGRVIAKPKPTDRLKDAERKRRSDR